MVERNWHNIASMSLIPIQHRPIIVYSCAMAGQGSLYICSKILLLETYLHNKKYVILPLTHIRMSEISAQLSWSNSCQNIYTLVKI